MTYCPMCDPDHVERESAFGYTPPVREELCEAHRGLKRRIARAEVQVSRDTGEFIVYAWDENGDRYEEADYYTDNLDDARDTRDLMLKEGRRGHD